MSFFKNMFAKMDEVSNQSGSKLSIILILLVVILIAGSGVLFWKYRKTELLLKQSQSNKTSDDEQLLSDISQLLMVPNEEPTIATVTDKEKLSKQAFFTQAENGDKVIIYTEAKKAILYRPSEKKIVDIAPLITEQTDDSSSPTGATQKATITLLNGSTKVGVTNSIDDRLIKTFPSITIKSKAAAVKNDYTQNIVVDITGNNSELVKQIATELGATVSSLPESEVPPQSDIVVIVGNN